MSKKAWASVCILALVSLLFPAHGQSPEIRIDIWEGATLADTMYSQPGDNTVTISVSAATTRVCVFTVPEAGPLANMGLLQLNHSGAARTSDLEIAILNLAGNIPLLGSDVPLPEGLNDWSGIAFSDGLAAWAVFTGQIAGDLTGGIAVKRIIRLGVGGQLAAPVLATQSGGVAIGFVVMDRSVSDGTIHGTISATAGNIGEIIALGDGVAIAGSISADNGSIFTVEATEGSIAIASSTGIRARNGIGSVAAKSIAANIKANHSGTGNIATLETSVGGFTGSLSANNVRPLLGPGGVVLIPARFYIEGELRADVTITNNVEVDVDIGGIPPRPDVHPAVGYSGLYRFQARSVRNIVVQGDAVFSLSNPGNALQRVSVNGEISVRGSLDGSLIINSASSTSRWTRLVVDGWLAAGIIYYQNNVVSGSLLGQPLPEVVVGKGFTGMLVTVESSTEDTVRLFALESDFVINQNALLSTGGEHPIGEMGGWVSVNVLSAPTTEPSSTVPRERDVIALSGFADVITGHRSSRPRDPGAGFGTPRFGNTLAPPKTDYAIGGVAVGRVPYSLHFADCNPRPVPGPASPPDPDNRPFSPLFYTMSSGTPPEKLDIEEPLESQFGRMDASVPERKVVLRFSGPVRAAPGLEFSPLRLQYVYFVGGSPNFTTIPESHYAVGIKAPSVGGLSREVTIIAEAGIGMAPGLYRVVLNPSEADPIVCDQRNGSGSAIPVQHFEYYFYVQADCGYDGQHEPAGTQCPCAYQTLCTRADFNQDSAIDGSDVEAFFDAWENGEPEADINMDSGVDGADIEVFLCWWEAGGCPS